MLISAITGHGKYEKGTNKGKPFISFKPTNGRSQTLSVTENMLKTALEVGYVGLNKIGLDEQYPTQNGDSTQMNEEGNPIYSKGEKLTVAQYWGRRNKALEAQCLKDNVEFKAIEARPLYNFAGFPTKLEASLYAGVRAQSFQTA